MTEYIDPKCVTDLPYTETALRTAVFEAVGAASVCWENMSGTGVFDDRRACEIGEALVAEILDLTRLGEPSLGCAMTYELLDELSARIMTDPKVAKYRTVGE